MPSSFTRFSPSVHRFHGRLPPTVRSPDAAVRRSGLGCAGLASSGVSLRTSLAMVRLCVIWYPGSSGWTGGAALPRWHGSSRWPRCSIASCPRSAQATGAPPGRTECGKPHGPREEMSKGLC